jgi:hypothetical protein
MNSSLLWLPVIVLGLFVVSMLPAFLAFLLEKRLVWPYVDLQEKKPPLAGWDADLPSPDEPPAHVLQVSITEYLRATNLMANQFGFLLLGAFRDGTSKLYRIRYNFWISPDRVVLALVGSGTLAGIPVSATWLYTRLRDGHCLLTLDDSKGEESDLSGLILQEVVTNADFAELLARHGQRLANAVQPAEPYSEDDPLEDHRAFRALRIDHLRERGLARYIGIERNARKYTLQGAFEGTLRTYSKQLRDLFQNRDRATITRPGQSGYIPSDLRSSRWVGLLDKAQFFFWIVLCVGVISTFSRGPAANRAQALFRAAVSGIGLAGVASIWVLKRMLVSSKIRGPGQPRADEHVEAGENEEIEFGTWREDGSPDRA